MLAKRLLVGSGVTRTMNLDAPGGGEVAAYVWFCDRLMLSPRIRSQCSSSTLATRVSSTGRVSNRSGAAAESSSAMIGEISIRIPQRVCAAATRIENVCGPQPPPLPRCPPPPKCVTPCVTLCTRSELTSGFDDTEDSEERLRELDQSTPMADDMWADLRDRLVGTVLTPFDGVEFARVARMFNRDARCASNGEQEEWWLRRVRGGGVEGLSPCLQWSTWLVLGACLGVVAVGGVRVCGCPVGTGVWAGSTGWLALPLPAVVAHGRGQRAASSARGEGGASLRQGLRKRC
jgi:hypothetical protein